MSLDNLANESIAKGLAKNGCTKDKPNLYRALHPSDVPDFSIGQTVWISRDNHSDFDAKIIYMFDLDALGFNERYYVLEIDTSMDSILELYPECAVRETEQYPEENKRLRDAYNKRWNPKEKKRAELWSDLQQAMRAVADASKALQKAVWDYSQDLDSDG